MIEAYKITTELTIKGNANNQMKLFAKLTKLANVELTAFLKKLKMIDIELKPLKDSLAIINPEFKSLNRTFTTLNKKLFSGVLNFEEMGMNIKKIIPEVAALKAELAGLKSVGRVRISGGMSTAGAGEAEAAAAGIGLGATGKKFIHGLGGGPMLALGAAGIAGMSLAHGFGQNKSFEQNLNMLRFQGFPPAMLDKIAAMARRPPKGFSPNDILESLIAGQMATQSFPAAMQLMTPLMQAEYTSKTTFGGMNRGQLQALARAAELRGHGQGPQIADWIGKFMQIYTLSGGTLDFRQLSQMSKQGFLAFTGQSFRGMAGAEPIAQVMGGGPFGTSMAGLMKTMHGVQLTGSSIKKVVAFMTTLGMWNPKGGGKFGALKPQYMNQLQTDMPEFILGSLMPAMMKKFNISNTEEGRNRMAQMLGIFNQNQGRMLGIGITQAPKIRATQARIPFLESLSTMNTQAHQSPAGALTDLTAAWNNFTQALEKTVQPVIIPTLNAFTTALNKMGGFFNSIGAGVNKATDFLHNADTGIIQGIKKAIHITTNLKVGARPIAHAVSKVQLKQFEAGGTQSNQSGFNGGISPTPSPFNEILY